ncbi:UNVERIFIED_CONTAM: hypothetical protein NCL1_49925 [Trichonephila clavipes]
MLHHFDGEFLCCDIKDFSYDSELARSRKTIKVIPAATSPLYINTSETQNAFSYCIKGANCKGTCCDHNCCPYTYATCCKNMYCNMGYKCCGNTRYNKAEWCCRRRKECPLFSEGICFDKGSFLIPSFLVSFSFAMIRVWFWKSLI